MSFRHECIFQGRKAFTSCALKTIINASQGPEPGRTRAFLERCLTKSSTHWPPQPPPPPPPSPPLQKPPLLLPYPPSHQAHGPRLLHHQSCNCGRTKKMLIEGSTGTQFDKQLCCIGKKYSVKIFCFYSEVPSPVFLRSPPRPTILLKKSFSKRCSQMTLICT